MQKIIERMMKRRNFLSILTNNMTAFRRNSTERVEESANEFILTGGKYVALFDALLGHQALTSFEGFYPRAVIIGVSGLDPEKGFFCHGNEEVNVKKHLFYKTAPVILIPVDHTKLGRPDSYLFGDISNFINKGGTERIVVTTPPQSSAVAASENYRTQVKKLEAKGIKVDEAKGP